MEEPESPSAEAVFRMEPAAAIVTLARLFVSGQRQLAQLRDLSENLPPSVLVDDVTTARAKLDALTAKWNSQQVPHFAASFRLALEVLDTYGPEGINVEDPTDAAIWNNKYLVWLREFGGEPTTDDDGGGGEEEGRGGGGGSRPQNIQ